eukprot:6212544-Pleurochrysis_carterae.AAC.1
MHDARATCMCRHETHREVGSEREFGEGQRRANKSLDKHTPSTNCRCFPHRLMRVLPFYKALLSLSRTSASLSVPNQRPPSAFKATRPLNKP